MTLKDFKVKVWTGSKLYPDGETEEGRTSSRGCLSSSDLEAPPNAQPSQVSLG